MTAGVDDLNLMADLGADIARLVTDSGTGLDRNRASLVLLSRLRHRLIRSACYVPDEIDTLLAEAIEAGVVTGMEY